MSEHDATTPRMDTMETAAATDVLDDLTDAQLATVEELARKCLEHGAALADVRGYTQDEMEAVYSLAHNAYRQRKYDEATKLFYFLAENDHTESRFWMGLGASLQMSGRPAQALAAYGMAAVLDATNPEPPLHACECYLATHDLEGARKALDAVTLICDATGGADMHGEVLRRTTFLSEAIDKADAR